MAQPIELVALIGELAAAYPNATVTPATIKVYVSDLGDLPLDVLAAAAKKHRLNNKWFPSVAELREAAVSITAPEQRSGLDAWGDVLAAIAKHGSYHPPNAPGLLAVGGYDWNFDDPLVGKVVAGMGWRELCLSETTMADRAHFLKAYEQERDRAYAAARLTPDLLAFQDQHRAALPAPTDRSKDIALLMAGLADKKGIR